MKQFTPEEIQKLEARFDTIDMGYLILRVAASMQRRGLLHGDYQGVLLADTNLKITNNTIQRCWQDIQALLDPAPSAASIAEPEPEAAAEEHLETAPKETIQ